MSVPKNSEKILQKVIQIKPNDTASAGDIIFFLKGVSQLPSDSSEFKAKATLMMYFFGKTAKAEPVMIIRNNELDYKDYYVEPLAMNVRFLGIDTEQGNIVIAVSMPDYDSDFLSLKVIEKPLINILWLGTFLLFLGFSVSIIRRM